MKIVLMTLGFLMITATVLPLLRKEAWWIRVFDFPRLQITVISAAVLTVYLWLKGDSGIAENLFLAALSLCLLYQSYMMYPYTVLSRKQVEQSVNPGKESSFSLLFANVLMDNRNASRLKEIINEADPDIILTVETNQWWQEQLKDFEESHPHVVQQPQDNMYGMHLFSRLELLDSEVKFLVQDDVPSIHARVRLMSGTVVELRCLHPPPPGPSGDERSTERDAELLIVGKETREKNVPVVVLGDLNDVAWSHTNYLFQDISGLLDPRIGRGFYHTFHAKYPFIRFPLDHFFHSKHFRLVDFRRLAYFGSDHFPVYIELSYG
ncbi:MAG: endonuclease/exonuclease/phosphatase family protein [Acidobacteria bacterium]|nr:endonuclease/exonuclease/phosphatase family protein [Acidobacteriota bacterium]